MGHISRICPEDYSVRARKVVVDVIVKDLLMVDRVSLTFYNIYKNLITLLYQSNGRHSNENWYNDNLVSYETLCKVNVTIFGLLIQDLFLMKILF